MLCDGGVTARIKINIRVQVHDLYSGREGHCRGGPSRCGPPESRRWPPKGRPLAVASRRSSAMPANLFEKIIL